MKLETILIFGGTSDLGASMVRHLKHRKCNVVFTYYRNKRAATALESSWDETKWGACRGYHCDLTSRKSLTQAWNLMNFSGFFPDKVAFFIGGKAGGDSNPISVIKLNLISAFWALEESKDRLSGKVDASIAIVSSTAGIRGVPTSNIYCASKAALNQLVRNYALRFAPVIRVNAVAPGVIETQKLKGVKRVRERSDIPLARYGSEREVCDLIEYLLFVGTYITGQVIVVDGGLTL